MTNGYYQGPRGMRQMQRAMHAQGGAFARHAYETELQVPYVAVDGPDTPYDLDSNPDAVREIKRALVELGKFQSDPQKVPDDPASEKLWMLIDPESEYWDGPTADEFALAIGRYGKQGFWNITGPFAQTTKVGLQPSARGLEILAGAVNQLLGGYPKMAIYEGWRNGTFAPPSLVSAPDANAPVIATLAYGPNFRFPPPDELAKDPAIAQAITATENALNSLWMQAPQQKNEASRSVIAATLAGLRQQRDSLVGILVDRAKKRMGEQPAGDDPGTVAACQKLGGVWNSQGKRCDPAPPTSNASVAPSGGFPIAGVAFAGAATAGFLYWWRKRKGAPKKR